MHILGKKTIISLTIVAVAIVLYWVSPLEAWFLPKCPFYVATGFECPACGTQRAIHELLHLNVQKAFAYNPFLFLSAPYLLLLVGMSCFKNEKILKAKSIIYGPSAIAIFLVLIILWWVVRNLI